MSELAVATVESPVADPVKDVLEELMFVVVADTSELDDPLDVLPFDSPLVSVPEIDPSVTGDSPVLLDGDVIECSLPAVEPVPWSDSPKAKSDWHPTASELTQTPISK